MSRPGSIRTWNRATFVYRIFDDSGALLYIGSTYDLDRRLKQHARTKAWWPTAATVTAREFTDEWVGAIGERVAIIDEAPIHNRVRKRVTEGDRRVTALCIRLSPAITTIDLRKQSAGDRR